MNNNVKKPDYDRSILSISSSIMKNYGLETNYKSLPELDDVLKKKYKNVIFLILDCLGSEIIKNNLSKKSFLRNNIITNVTSVFPPTTAAATIAFHSGQSPYENGWIGWMPYFKDYNKMIELFSGKDFYTRERIVDLPEKGLLKYKTIYEKICEKEKRVKYTKIFPNYDGNGVDSFEEMCNKIKITCQNNKENLISAYWNEPDHTIHYNGVKSKNVKEVVKNIDNNLMKLSKELKDSIIIISADHGAVNVKEVYLNEIKEIDDCLKMPPSIESRFVSFFVKEGMKDKFIKSLEKNFKNNYILFSKEEFLKEGLLGRGKKHNRIDEYLGDYILVANSNLNLRYSITGERDKVHLADHGGITSEEITVPLIVIKCE